MKKHAKKIMKHPLVRGSTIVVFGGLLANFLNFLFNLFMSRTLSVTDYGTLASIIILITFPALLANAINPVVIRFAGAYFAKGELALVRGLYLKFAKFFALVGIIGFLIFLFSLSAISNFFHVTDNVALFFANIIMFIGLLTITNTAFLQAKLAFGATVIIGFVSSLVKLSLGILFVYLGYSVTGAVGALVIASILLYLLGLYPLRFIFSKKFQSPHIDSKELFTYGIPSALTLIGLTSFISADILMTKHFFTSEQAGLYAGLALMGRIIFYLTVPISSVMFPIVVRKHSMQENFSNTFKLALLFVFLPSALLTGFYFFFPSFSILFFLKKAEYLAIAPYLWLFGTYITCYCLLYLLATFYLSIKKTMVYVPIIIGAFLQIILIALYHNAIQEIIMISFSIVLVLVFGFLLYYPYATKR